MAKLLKHQVGNYGNRFEVVLYGKEHRWSPAPNRVLKRWVFDTMRAAYEDAAQREKMTLGNYLSAVELEFNVPLRLSFDPRPISIPF